MTTPKYCMCIAPGKGNHSMHLQSAGCIPWSTEPALDGMRMSRTMYWSPTPPEPQKNDLPDQLKYILIRRYWDADGIATTQRLHFNKNDISYLTGLADCNVEGAQDLIDAIRRKISVDVWFE